MKYEDFKTNFAHEIDINTVNLTINSKGAYRISWKNPSLRIPFDKIKTMLIFCVNSNTHIVSIHQTRKYIHFYIQDNKKSA